jgi:hypothetical protein
VRETWSAPDACECSETCHTPGHVFYHANDVGYRNAQFNRKRPSIFMPRWACRLVLELTDVRVERIRDISVADCRAEGAEGGDSTNEIGWRYSFGSTWNALNEKRGFGWDVNPWVWVLSFRRADQ